MLLIIILVSLYGQLKGATDERCRQYKKAGTECFAPDPDNLDRQLELPSPILRFYYNDTARYCFAFGFRGCNGNRNNFESIAECMKTCTPEDDPPTCAPSLEEPGHISFDNLCPGGFTPKPYVTNFQYKKCCPLAAEEVFVEAAGNCKDGTTPVLTLDAENQFNRTLLGDSCEDLPCPKQHKCETVSFFAKCCLIRRPLLTKNWLF